MSKNLPFLTSKEAAFLLKQFGKNELPTDSKFRFLRMISEILFEPMLLLLFVCSGVYFFIGKLDEALLLMGSAIFAATITLVQQFKSEKALEKLKVIASPRASVIRDGEEVRIAGSEVVPRDIIVIREGDRIPADATLIKSEHLEVDESILTGESLTIKKTVGSVVFSGAMVVSGHAIAQVTATGVKTEFGKIGKSLQVLQQDRRTVFQEQTAYFVKVLGVIAVSFCMAVLLIYGLQKNDWPNAILAGLSTAMSLLPEEMPIVVTLFLVLGAWRISKNSVLTRKMAAIENLGVTTVLCVDKTGTLTENKMQLATFWSEDFKKDHLLAVSFAANHSTTYDAMEKAIESSYQAARLREEVCSFDDWKRVKEYGLSAKLPLVSGVWKKSHDKELWVAAKGAPETVLSLCGLEKNQFEKILGKAKEMASRGERVLGLAECTVPIDCLPENQQGFPFQFVGLIGFEDPVREGVSQAMAECYGAGIRVIVMTGDHPGTAQAVGRKIGLKNADDFIVGTELDKFSEDELKQKISYTNIFARLRPEQKLHLVKCLQDLGELVSMTGDGINDAPALKSADIGIAMGKRGTDVAREASDLVLLDDNFASIVRAVRLGRRIFDNVKSAISYIVAIHVPIAALALFPVLFGMPLILLPPQIVFLEFIIDPACSFVFEAETEDSNIMKRPPRTRGKKIFNKELFFWSAMQGLIVSAVVFVAYALASRYGSDVNHARSLAFTSLIFGNLALIFVNRAGNSGVFNLLHKENRLFQLIVAIVIVALIATFMTPFLKELFAFGHLEISDLVFSVISGLMVLLTAQMAKNLYFEKVEK